MILISDVWAEFKFLWQVLHYRIMQPSPILSQGGLSLPIIPIPPNSPPPNHSVLSPNHPPNSPTHENLVLTPTPSSQPNRPLTALPPSPSTHFPTTPLVTITPAPRTLINTIPFETTTRKLAQSQNDCTFTTLETITRIKRPKSASMSHTHRNNSNIVDSISLHQYDYQNDRYLETDSVKTHFF